MKRSTALLLAAGFATFGLAVGEAHPSSTRGTADAALVWSIVDIEAGSPEGISLAVTNAGAPRITYVNEEGTVKYAFCDSGCTDALNWGFVDIGTASNPYALQHTSLALGPDDKPHVLVWDSDGSNYTYCDGDCSDPLGWSVPLDIACPNSLEALGPRYIAVDSASNPRTTCFGIDPVLIATMLQRS